MLEKDEAVMLSQEAEMVAGRVAAEAVEEALAVVDVKGWGLLFVEGAAAPEISTARLRFAPIPRHDTPDDFRQGNAFTQGSQEVF